MCRRNKGRDCYQQAFHMFSGDKTVIIVVLVPRHSVSCDAHHINIDGHDFDPAGTVRILGIISDDKHTYLQDIARLSEEYFEHSQFSPR